MVDSLLDMYVRDSKAYNNIMADAGFHFAASYMSVDHEGVIRATEDIEDIIMALQALEIDKGIPFSIDEFDDSAYSQRMFVKLAGMCNGHFAHDTLCQYLDDAGFVKGQLAIAQHVPHFYSKVTDKARIRAEVQSYLKVIE